MPWYDNRHACEVFGWIYILVVCGIVTLIAERVWNIIKERIGKEN